MAINLNSNFGIFAPNPIDDRYLSPRTSAGSQLPYSADTEVITTITESRRYEGLTVLIQTGSMAIEYWFSGGIADDDLIEKKYASEQLVGAFITGATNLGYFSGTTSIQTLTINSGGGSTYNGDYLSIYNYYYRDISGVIRIGKAAYNEPFRRAYYNSVDDKSWIWDVNTGGWRFVDGDIRDLVGEISTLGYDYGPVYYIDDEWSNTGGNGSGYYNTGSSASVNVTGDLTSGDDITVGQPIYKDKSNQELHLRTIINDTPDVMKIDTDDYYVRFSGVTSVINAENIGTGEQIFAQKTGTTLQLRTLVGSGGTQVISVGDEIRFYNEAGGVTTAENGVSLKNGDDSTIVLGGNLTQNTVISGSSQYNFNFSGINNFQIKPDGLSDITFGIDEQGLIFTFTGGSVSYDNNTGLVYGSDYSGSFIEESLVTKRYVDNVAVGLHPIEAVLVATTGQTFLGGTQTIDGIALNIGDRVLVKDQSNAMQNGIYIVLTGEWQRSQDFDGDPPTEVKKGTIIPVISGNTNRNSQWILITEDPEIDVTDLDFIIFNYGIYREGTGIDILNNEINVDGSSLAGNSISWTGNTFNVDINTGTLSTALDSKLNVADFNTFTGTTITGATNIGSGDGEIYDGVTNRDLRLRTIKGSGDTDVSLSGDTIVVYSDSSGLLFDEDITVSLDDGKTFGKYVDGDTIPSSGKTAAEVIKLATFEAIDPTATLSSSGNNVAFGESGKTVNLNFSYTINTPNATVSGTTLEWRRGSTGTWSGLTITTGDTGYNHTIDDSADRFNTDIINYRYTVVDSNDSSVTVTHNVSPQSYASPTMSIILNGTLDGIDETQNNREKGNVSGGTSSASIVSNRSLVNITEWTIERRYDSGSWTVLTSGTTASTTVMISATTDNGVPTTATSIDYRITYIDEYTSGSGGLQNILFFYYSYYGYDSNLTLSSAQIIGLDNKDELNNQNLTWNNVISPSGEYTYYVYPSNYSDLTSIVKNGVLQDFGAWSQLSQVNVTNTYGEARNYKVWKTNATQAYSGDNLVFS